MDHVCNLPHKTIFRFNKTIKEYIWYHCVLVTHMSWGSVESSVFEYKNNEPPLLILRNFKDAKSVYSFVTANMSTQTPDWTATAACKTYFQSYILNHVLN